MTLAQSADMIERVLQGQSGVALGLILGGLLSFLGVKFYLDRFLRKIDEAIEAQNRLCKAVAALLIESQLHGVKQVGQDVLGEIGQRK